MHVNYSVHIKVSMPSGVILVISTATKTKQKQNKTK